MSCGADLVANNLMTSLGQGEDFTIPAFNVTGPEFEIPGGANSPVYGEIPKLTLADLTERVIGGAGVFDGMMDAVKAHLQEEFKNGRITGAEYTKAYIAMVQSCMDGAVTFLLQRDAAYWAGVNAQIAAITGKVQLKKAAVDLAIAQIQAANVKADYTLTKLKLANEDATYCLNQKNLDILTFNLVSMLPMQLKLATEQMETQRANTSDVRSDGQPVLGMTGQQKSLYAQQIISYKRSAEINAAKLFTDAWISHKAVDEGIDTPASFNAANISQVLSSVKTNNGI